MTDPLDLDRLEERAFRSRYDTGLLDLVFGLFVLLFGLSLHTEFGALAGVWAAVGMSMFFALHKLIVEPRLGYAEFGPGRRAKVRHKKLVMSLALGLSMLAGVAVWLALSSDRAALRETMKDLGPIPFAVMLAAMASVGSALIGIRRGHAYAVVIVAIIAGGHRAGMDLRETMSAAGAIVAVCGAVVLSRFQRRHPRPVEDGSHGGA